MAELKKIIKNGSTYTFPSGGGGSTNVIELTKAEYEALTDPDPNTIYIITDVDGGKTYSAGTNIEITSNNVINVTGITVPTKVSELENDSNYATESELPTVPEFRTINGEAITGDTTDIEIEGGGTTVVEITQADYNALSDEEKQDTTKLYAISDADSNYYTKEEVNTLTGTCYSAATANTWSPTTFYGTGYVGIQRSGTTTSTYNGIRISGSTSNFSIYTGSTSVNNSGVRYWQLNDISTASTNMNTAINAKISAYTKTSDFATINGNVITSGGNINIGTQSTEMGVQEVTQEYYNSLTEEEKAANILFIITDATLPTEWTGTQAEYDALGTYDSNCTYYII